MRYSKGILTPYAKVLALSSVVPCLILPLRLKFAPLLGLNTLAAFSLGDDRAGPISVRHAAAFATSANWAGRGGGRDMRETSETRRPESEADISVSHARLLLF